MRKYLNLDLSTQNHFILESGEGKEVIAKDDFQYLQEIHNATQFQCIYGYQLYYNLFNNNDIIVFYNEKSLIHIIFDITKNTMFMIDLNDDNLIENEDLMEELIKEMKQHNIQDQDIDQFIEEATY